MKNTKLLLFIVFMSVFGACQKQVSLDIDPEESCDDETIEVLLSASFSNVITRTYPSTIDDMRKARLSFDGLRIVFYEVNQESKPIKVAYSFDCDISAKKGVLSGKDFIKGESTESEFIVKVPLKIKRGNYHVYMIAGVTDVIKSATSVGKEFSLMSSALTRDEKEFYARGYLKNSIFINSTPILISEKSAVKKAESNESYQLDQCILAPINAFASVQWRPIVNDKNYIISSNSILVFTDVINKKYILLPKYDQSVKAKLDIDFPIDSNYSNFGTKDFDSLQDDFLYQPLHNKDGSEKFTFYYSSKDERENSYLIIPENTMDANDCWGTVVSRLIVMAIMYPKGMDLGDTDLDNITSRDLLPSWIYFKGKGYSEIEFDELYAKSNKSETKSRDDMDVITAYRELKGSQDKYPQDSYQSNAIRYYKHGTSFFSIPIQHFTKEQIKDDPSLPGLYSVVRNTHYNINIKSFQSIGAATMKALVRNINYKDVMNANASGVKFSDVNVIEKDIDTLY